MTMKTPSAWYKKLFTSAVVAVLLLVPSIPPIQAQTPAPVISTFSVAPDPFNPEQGDLTVSWTLQNADAWVEVHIDLNGVHKRTIQTPAFQNIGQHSVTWDGKINGQNAAAGTYHAYIHAYTNNGGDIRTTPINLAYGVSSTAPIISNDSASPSPFDPVSQSTTIRYDLSTQLPADVSIAIRNSANQIVETLTLQNNLTTANNYTQTWDGKNSNNQPFPEGNYTYEITATNDNNQTDFADGLVEIDYAGGGGSTAPVITNDSASPSTFDPNQTPTTIRYDLTTQLPADVSIAIRSNITGGIVETLPLRTNLTTATNYTQTWDGKDSSNVRFPEGSYDYEITATNDNNQIDFERGPITINYQSGGGNTAPIISNQSASPFSFDPDDQSTTIRFDLTTQLPADVSIAIRRNSTNQIVETLPARLNLTTATNYTQTWDGKDSSNVRFPEGSYTFEITATNDNNQTDFKTGQVVIDFDGDNGGSSAPSISNHFASPNPFDPQEENTRIFFTLNTPADVTIEILRTNGTLVDTLIDDVSKPSGSTNVMWDGRDRFNNFVSNGTYTYRITAQNGFGTDVETGDVRVFDGTGGGGNSGNLISNVRVENRVFDPSRNQVTRVCFDIENDDTYITIDILDRNVVVDTLINNLRLDEQSDRCQSWDGEDRNGNTVRDGVYEFRVRADRGNETEVEFVFTEVDTDGNSGDGNGTTCAGFHDVQRTSPLCRAIELMYFRGIFTGYPDGSFRPGSEINRAEATKVIMLALEYNILPDDGSNLGFRDVIRGAWYMPYLRTARQANVIHGYPNGTFRPEGHVNRVELLKIFLEASDIQVPSCNYSPYPDTPLNSETRWYMNYACFAKAYGLMQTDQRGFFNPAQPMTRGDVADLFYQFERRGLRYGMNNSYYNNYYDNFNTTNYNSPYGYVDGYYSDPYNSGYYSDPYYNSNTYYNDPYYNNSNYYNDPYYNNTYVY